MKRDDIIKQLGKGKDNAVSMSALATNNGMTERNLRRTIQELRLEGVAIIGDSRGYYLPSGREELQGYYNMAHKRAIKSLATLKTVHIDLNELPYQMSIVDLMEGTINNE